MNVQSIITNAIFNSVQDAQFQPDINAGYQAFALAELNRVLDSWRDVIPFGTEITFNNVTDLNATSFVEVDTVQYVLITSNTNNVAFFLQSVSESEYKRLQGIIGLTSFPNVYYFDQLLQKINIYPLPSQQPYQFIVRGRVSQINLGLFDTIPANMPGFMQDAIIYEIAFRLCARYGTPWDVKKETIRQSAYKKMENMKEIDLTSDIQCVFGAPSTSRNAPFPTWFYISGGGQ